MRARREALGVSQEDFANQLGLGRRYYGAVERGEVSATLDRIVIIAEGLRVQPADLMPVLRRRS